MLPYYIKIVNYVVYCFIYPHVEISLIAYSWCRVKFILGIIDLDSIVVPHVHIDLGTKRILPTRLKPQIKLKLIEMGSSLVCSSNKPCHALVGLIIHWLISPFGFHVGLSIVYAPMSRVFPMFEPILPVFCILKFSTRGESEVDFKEIFSTFLAGSKLCQNGF